MELAIYGWVFVAWACGIFAAADATRRKGHGGGAGGVYAFLFGPIFGLLYAAALPDRGAAAPPTEAASPSTRTKPAGPDLERWAAARAEGRLCDACMAILPEPLKSGDRCPECSRRKA